MTDRQQLERLIAIAKQSREAQKAYYKNRKSVSPDYAKRLLNDARMKADSLDNLIIKLERSGYEANKHEDIKAEQPKMF